MKQLLFAGILSVVAFFPVQSIRAATTLFRVAATPTPTPVPTAATRRIALPSVLPTATPVPERQYRGVSTSTPTPAPVRLNTNQLQIPSPATTGTQVAGRTLILDKDTVGQETMLNPQPEPPIYDSALVKNAGAAPTLTWPAFTLPKPLTSTVEFAPEGARITIPKTLAGTNGTVKLLVKPDFKIEGNRTILKTNGSEVVLRSLPTAMYQKMSTVLGTKGITLMDDLTLDIIGGKAVYSVTIDEPVNILGLIPSRMKAVLAIADEDGMPTVTGKPWYGAISREVTPVVAEFVKLPNLVVKDIRFEPAQFSAGQEVRVIATFVNEGLGYALGFPSFLITPGSGGPTASLKLPDHNNGTYAWYPVIISMAPGDTWVFDDFTIVQAECGLTIRVELANNEKNNVEETTKEDNALTATMACQ